MMKPLLIASIILASALPFGSAAAQDATPIPPAPLPGEQILACAPLYDQCAEACRINNPENSAARAGCISRCAADRAVCEAKEGYAEVKPWLQEKLQSFGDFLEGFREGPGAEEPPRRNYPPERPEPLLPEKSDNGSVGSRAI